GARCTIRALLCAEKTCKESLFNSTHDCSPNPRQGKPIFMSVITPQHRFSQKLSVRRATSHSRRSERWAVILAGGDGTRLQSMTRSITGDDRPKQFVPVIGGSTLLEQTRRRVGLSVLPGHTFFVVTEKHQRFYRSMADSVSPNLLLE